MLRSLWVLGVYLSFIGMGVMAPFILSLGYLWVDLFRPQLVAYILLPSIPVSMIMGALAFGAYFLMDRQAPPRLNMTLVLTLMFGAWITLTTLFLAVAPDQAWRKWDWAVKTVLFSAFIPFVIRSRVQIEAFLQIYLFALAIHVMPTGLKTMISGGGYGRELGLVGGNTGFGEGSTLATVAIMTIPIIVWLMRHNILMPRLALTRLMYMGMAVVALACTVGTYARTGLIGMVVVGGVMWFRSQRKMVFSLVILAGAALVGAIASDRWEARVSTINDPTENSSLGRILVWRWTIGYVASHPFGGGFDSYLISEITMPPAEGESEGLVIRGKAFHNAYIEVLGEHGYPGLAIFLGLILCSVIGLQRTAAWAKKTEGMAWLRDLALALQTSLVTLIACSMFIGIAFQPMFYYIFALNICLTNYRQRAAVALQAAPTQAVEAPGAPPAAAASGGWRGRYRPAPEAVGTARGWPDGKVARVVR
jgi:probable O-glycosylation ligase (exosortase A-associated)